MGFRSAADSFAAVTWLLASAACAPPAPGQAAHPLVPPVASIPVAPASTPDATSKTPEWASSSPQIEGPGSAETAPLTLPLSPSGAPQPKGILLVDELPFRPWRRHAGQPSELAPSTRRHHTKRGRHGRAFHPAPGIVVDVVDAQAEASGTGDLQRSARNIGYWPFRNCYEEGLRRDQRLAGKVSLELSIGPNGTIDGATIVDTSIRDESVSLCIAREALHLGGSPTEPRTTIASTKENAHPLASEARMFITLSTGDEPVPVPPAVPHADELRAALRAAWPAIERCYAAEGAVRPDAGGRLELRFKAKSNGDVVEVAEGDTQFSDGDVTRCALAVYRTTKLPEFNGGPRRVSFTYALHLEARR